VVEMPRLARYSFKGIRKSEADNIRDIIRLQSGRIVTEDVKNRVVNSIENYFIDKGFFNVKAWIVEKPDEIMQHASYLTINVDKGSRVKIDEIVFNGVESIPERKLKRALKDTKQKRWWSIFKTSKFIEEEFDAGVQGLVTAYNVEGFRNAIIKDTKVEKVDEKLIRVTVDIDEGDRFYFRNMSFTGNTKYRTSELDSILRIRPGDVYDISKLQSRLYMNQKGRDVTSLYQDNGYLNFFAVPIETLVEGDSIDIEIRMEEGKKFRIGSVTVTGNTKTNDHVIYREIRTRPGDLFSRNDIIRTQRELSQLGYFNPEAFDVIPSQNVQEGTVDIEYIVEEKPSDQIELSGGWGAGRVVGSLGVTFTNFSLKNMFKKGAWRPLPSGDGQRISLRAVSNGLFFQSYNLSFVEPWLGGKKPTSLSLAAWHSVQSNGQKKKIDGELNPLRQSLLITGGSVGFGKRLQWPDDWFLFQATLSYQNFDLNNFGSFFSFTNGEANNLALELKLQRNSVSDLIFPTWGSNVMLSAKLTPPWHKVRFDKDEDYSLLSDQEKYRWVEYYKLKFTANWYTTLFSHRSGEEGSSRNLVLATSVGVGFLGAYNQELGESPFERFYLGGVFLSGFVLDGREIVNLRGYNELSLTFPSQDVGSPIISKYSMELRYPLSTNPNAYIYPLVFLEAGKTWGAFEDYNPFNVMRSGGVGMRIFLPMFGMLGFDYGWRFDDHPFVPNMPRGQFHFSIGMNLGEL
jgi:outer membrane protein insertion porin family